MLLARQWLRLRLHRSGFSHAIGSAPHTLSEEEQDAGRPMVMLILYTAVVWTPEDNATVQYSEYSIAKLALGGLWARSALCHTTGRTPLGLDLHPPYKRSLITDGSLYL